MKILLMALVVAGMVGTVIPAQGGVQSDGSLSPTNDHNHSPHPCFSDDICKGGAAERLRNEKGSAQGWPRIQEQGEIE